MEPIEYLEFEIEVGQGRDGEYPVSAASAAGQAQETMRLPFDPQALGSELEGLRTEAPTSLAEAVVPVTEVTGKPAA